MGLAEGFNAVEAAKANREKLRQETATHNASMAKAGIDPNTGEILPGGNTEVERDNMAQQLQLMQQQLQRQQNTIDANDSAFHVKEAVSTGDFTRIQSFFEKNPRVAKVWEQQGVKRIDNINFDKDKQLLITKGFTPEQIDNPEVRDKIGRLLFKVQDPTGNWKIGSAENIFKQTNLQSRIASSEWENINNTFREAKTSLTPKAEPSGPLAQFTAAYKDLFGPDVSPEEVMEAYSKAEAKKKESKGFEPFSIQEAKFVADLETKVSKGLATEEETSQLDAYKRNEAGASYKTNVATKEDVKKFEEKYNFNLATGDSDAIPTEAKGELNRIIKDIENTPAGKEVTKLISHNITGGIGAVTTTVSKLEKLAKEDKVETGVVKNQLDKLKEYIPESWRGVDEKDLANTEFRKAFLSVSSTILKLQSGLTVTDAERADFQSSMGSLNRNTKTNLSGIKLKFDEIKANYDSIKQIEPTLFNLKYSKTAATLSNLSSSLDKLISPTETEQEPTSIPGPKATEGTAKPTQRKPLSSFRIGQE